MAARRALAVYYSLSGHTRAVAERIARDLDADVEEIVPAQERAGARLYWATFIACFTRAAWETRPPAHEVASYDLIIVGGPIWMQRIAAPVRGWLRQNRLGASANFAAFVTAQTPSVSVAFDELARLAGKPAAATLVVSNDVQRAGRRRSLSRSSSPA